MGICPVGIDEPSAAPTPAASPTVLFVGAWAGRKRGEFVHRTFSDEVLPRVPEAQLWMVSDHCIETGRVRWFSSPSDEELGGLYSRAWVLAAPSCTRVSGVLPRGDGVGHDGRRDSESGVGITSSIRAGRAGWCRMADSPGRSSEALENPDMRAGYVARGRERVGDLLGKGGGGPHPRLRARDRTLVAWCPRSLSGSAPSGGSVGSISAQRHGTLFCAGAGPERRFPWRRGSRCMDESREIPRSDRGSSGAGANPDPHT